MYVESVLSQPLIEQKHARVHSKQLGGRTLLRGAVVLLDFIWQLELFL